MCTVKHQSEGEKAGQLRLRLHTANAIGPERRARPEKAGRSPTRSQPPQRQGSQKRFAVDPFFSFLSFFPSHPRPRLWQPSQNQRTEADCLSLTGCVRPYSEPLRRSPYRPDALSRLLEIYLFIYSSIYFAVLGFEILKSHSVSGLEGGRFGARGVI